MKLNNVCLFVSTILHSEYITVINQEQLYTQNGNHKMSFRFLKLYSLSTVIMNNNILSLGQIIISVKRKNVQNIT